jgi:hypothetical protein
LQSAKRVGDEVFIADKLQVVRKVDPGTDVAPIALDSFFECVANPEVALRAQQLALYRRNDPTTALGSRNMKTIVLSGRDPSIR